MSVSDANDGSFSILFRVGGKGTQLLSTVRQGDEIDLIGPLGMPFDISPFICSPDDEAVDNEELFHVKQEAPHALLVGGGIGVPPLIYLSQLLDDLGIDCTSIVGARSSPEVIGFRELSVSCDQRVKVMTEDGSRGHRGRVTDLLPAVLGELTQKNVCGAVRPIVYSCGPLPMLRAVARVCRDESVRCQVSMEENMPCGIGVCNGCVVRAHEPFASSTGQDDALNTNEAVGSEWSPYHSYRRVCVEGPACWADEIDWEF